MDPATPLTDIPLPEKVLRLLAGSGVSTAGELAAMTDPELVAVRGVGPTGVLRVRRLFPAPDPPAGTGAWRRHIDSAERWAEGR